MERYNNDAGKENSGTDLDLIKFSGTNEILLKNISKKNMAIYNTDKEYGEYLWWLASISHLAHIYDI